MLYAGGDHDVNDLIVGFDFNSNAGQGWLQLGRVTRRQEGSVRFGRTVSYETPMQRASYRNFK